MGSQLASAGAIFNLDFSYANRVFNPCLPPPCYTVNCTPTPCPPPIEYIPFSDQGSGTITFPDLASPASGLELELTFFGSPSFKFTEEDIQEISWEIATDMQILKSLYLELRTNPGCPGATHCTYSTAYVGITDNVGGWRSNSYSCSNFGCTLPEPLSSYPLATASPGAFIPVPTSLALIVVGLAGLTRARQRKSNNYCTQN